MRFLTIEEKISRLQAAAMEERRARKKWIIIRRHEEALEGVFEQHRKEAVRQVLNKSACRGSK